MKKVIYNFNDQLLNSLQLEYDFIWLIVYKLTVYTNNKIKELISLSIRETRIIFI